MARAGQPTPMEVYRDSTVGLSWVCYYDADLEIHSDITGASAVLTVTSRGTVIITKTSALGGLTIVPANDALDTEARINWAYTKAESLLIPEGNIATYSLQITRADGLEEPGFFGPMIGITA